MQKGGERIQKKKQPIRFLEWNYPLKKEKKTKKVWIRSFPTTERSNLRDLRYSFADPQFWNGTGIRLDRSADDDSQ